MTDVGGCIYDGAYREAAASYAAAKAIAALHEAEVVGAAHIRQILCGGPVVAAVFGVEEMVVPMVACRREENATAISTCVLTSVHTVLYNPCAGAVY